VHVQAYLAKTAFIGTMQPNDYKVDKNDANNHNYYIPPEKFIVDKNELESYK